CFPLTFCRLVSRAELSPVSALSLSPAAAPTPERVAAAAGGPGGPGREVQVDRAGLGALLRRVVTVMADRPVRTLELLHAALAGVVAKYTLQTDRRDLVQALDAVVDAYQLQDQRSRSPSTPSTP
ncbi:Thiamine thiazole synthase, partial [Frankliniella fusca]